MRYSEEELKRWTNPPSETEDEKLQNAERMVKDAINSDEKLCSMNITIFCQGSYANNTNIRLDSDIDVNVCYTDAFYYDLPEGYGKDYFGLGNSCHYSFSEYKTIKHEGEHGHVGHLFIPGIILLAIGIIGGLAIYYNYFN